MTEREFQRAVMDLAQLCGWETLHVRTSMQANRYLTATSGTMAKGWPDLVLVKGRRLIFAELKSDKGRPRSEQVRVMSVLNLLAPPSDPNLKVVLWRPSDWPTIEATLGLQRRDAA
jgi:hypothetical protein